ncbi:MAG TPA: hypothetical protein VFU31_27815 [Candidatus Binatia bacterium]|nr:hypothetical protein [Candidatus Binatia bacterium]
MAPHNNAGMHSATTGTGTLTLTTAVNGFNTFANAGVVTGEILKFTIMDGLNRETSIGTYTAAGLTLTRDTVESSTNGGSKIDCSGNQNVFIVNPASDFAVGWMPYAYMMGYPLTTAIGTSLAIAANGGTLAVPVYLPAPMALESVSIWQTDTATAREWRWDLYLDAVNDALSSSNTLTRKAAATAVQAFTPSAASKQTIAAATDPTKLSPGLYWLAIQSTHATSALTIGAIADNDFTNNTAQTKTTTNPNGATLDMVSATWTKVTDLYCVRLNGQVFGGSSLF